MRAETFGSRENKMKEKIKQVAKKVGICILWAIVVLAIYFVASIVG